MKPNRQFKLLLLYLFFSTFTRGQEIPTYQARLKPVYISAFYKIPLSPEVVARATKDLYDLRIFDKENKQVPYLLRTDVPVFTENNFLELKVVSIKKEVDKLTHIIINNLPGKEVSELFLVVKNNDVSRTVTLSGSDDAKQWFVIKENIPLVNIVSQTSDRYVQSLQFPLSSYAYFKIIIDGKDLLPINIIRAGIYEDVMRSGKYIENPSPAITQKDSGNYSYVTMIFSKPYRSDQLNFTISGPRYFQRQANLYAIENGVKKDVQNLSLISGKSQVFPTDFKAIQLEMVIENDDNPALKVDAVKSFQLGRYLLASLDSAQNYRLAFGNGELPAPRYDIAYFRDSLRNTNSVVETGLVEIVAGKKAVKNGEGIASTVIMWAIIGGVLVLLLFLTMRMTKELNAKK